MFKVYLGRGLNHQSTGFGEKAPTIMSTKYITFRRSYHLSEPGMWKRLFFKRFRFHQQKTKKRPLTIFFNFCGSVACLLLHFIILRRQKPSFIAITSPTSLKRIVSNYFCVSLLNVEQRFSIFLSSRSP